MVENAGMDYSDWLWIKLIGFAVICFVVAFWKALNGR